MFEVSERNIVMFACQVAALPHYSADLEWVNASPINLTRVDVPLHRAQPLQQQVRSAAIEERPREGTVTREPPLLTDPHRSFHRLIRNAHEGVDTPLISCDAESRPQALHVMMERCLARRFLSPSSADAERPRSVHDPHVSATNAAGSP
jgi:hypothetical protein